MFGTSVGNSPLNQNFTTSTSQPYQQSPPGSNIPPVVGSTGFNYMSLPESVERMKKDPEYKKAINSIPQATSVRNILCRVQGEWKLFGYSEQQNGKKLKQRDIKMITDLWEEYNLDKPQGCGGGLCCMYTAFATIILSPFGCMQAAKYKKQREQRRKYNRRNFYAACKFLEKEHFDMVSIRLTPGYLSQYIIINLDYMAEQYNHPIENNENHLRDLGIKDESYLIKKGQMREDHRKVYPLLRFTGLYLINEQGVNVDLECILQSKRYQLL